MLTRVRIENFKSFSSTTSFPMSPLTLVLGANGAGKSNFFDALRLLKSIGAGSSIRDAVEGYATPDPTGIRIPGIRGGASTLPYRGGDSPIFRLEATFRSSRDTIEYGISIDAMSYRVTSETLKSHDHPGQYVFTTESDTGAHPYDPDAPSILAHYYTKAPGRNPSTAFSPHASILSQFRDRRSHSKLNEDIATLARTELEGIRHLELAPEVLRQYSPRSVFDIGERGENFAAVVWLLRLLAEREEEAGSEPHPYSDQLDAIEAWLGELTPNSIQHVTTVSAPTEDVLFAVVEEPFESPLTARSLSDGTLRFSALSIALLVRSFTGGPRHRTLVIEELENGMNPARLHLLMKLLESTTGSRDEVQVVASTHSPSLLNWASDGTLRACLVVGWNHQRNCSNVVRLGSADEFDGLRGRIKAGELQEEGWFEYLADTP
jgi:hypothetical protein